MALFSERTMESLYAHRELISDLIDVCNVADLIMRIILCIFGNWLYFRFAVNTLKKMKKYSDGDITKERAAASGGIRPLNMLLALLMIGAMTFVILMASIVAIETISLMKNMYV